MLTGLGDEEWLTQSYQDTRNKVREDRTKYDSEDIERYDCESINIGGGETNDKSFEIKQYPYPRLSPRATLDIRLYDDRISD